MTNLEKPQAVKLFSSPEGLTFRVDPSALDWSDRIVTSLVPQQQATRLELAVELTASAVRSGNRILAIFTGYGLTNNMDITAGGEIEERLDINMFPDRNEEIFPSEFVVGNQEVERLTHTKDGYLVMLAKRIHHSAIHPRVEFQRPDQPTWVTEGAAVALETSFFPVLINLKPEGFNSLLCDLMHRSRVEADFPREILNTHKNALLRMINEGLWFNEEQFGLVDQYVPYGNSPLWFDGGSDGRQYYERPGYFQAAIAFMFMMSDLFDLDLNLSDYIGLPIPDTASLNHHTPSQKVLEWNRAVGKLGLYPPEGFDTYSQYCLHRSLDYSASLSSNEINRLPSY